MDFTRESMGRRAAKNGDEIDYLTRDRKYHNCYHGVVSRVKHGQRRRTRRQMRIELRSERTI